MSLTFNDTPLAEALRKIDKAQADKHIHFVFDELENLRVTKTIKNKSAFDAVKMVCDKLPVSVEMKGKDIFVEAKKEEKKAASLTLIFADVQDAFLHTPLAGAKVSLLAGDGVTVLEDSIAVNKRMNDDGTLRKAQIVLTLPRETADFQLRAQLEGYDDAVQPFHIDSDEERGQMFTLGLRRSLSRKLDEVVVTATRIKMYYKGDTLVYDATAFKMPDGSMLDDLIRQMPDVTMNDDGEIFVKGRKVEELLLGSRSFMNGNRKILLENLPYYTVKHIKVYEQESDLSRAMGREMTPKKFVMDVNLKPEFSRGYIGNAEVAAGTEKRWLGRAFLLGFEDRWRLTFFSNLNNVNESRHIGQANHWTPASAPRSLLTTRSLAGEIDYQTDDHNYQENLNIDYASTKDESEMRQRRELFLDGAPFSTSRATSLSKASRLKLRNQFKIIKPSCLFLDLTATLERGTFSGNSASLSEQFADSLTTRQLNDGFRDGSSWKAGLSGMILPKFKPSNNGRTRSLLVMPNISYSTENSQSAQRFTTTSFVNPATERQHNASNYSNTFLNFAPRFVYETSLKKAMLTIHEVPSYTSTKTRDWLYHPDTLMLPSQIDMLDAITDHRNSYDSDERDFRNTVQFELTKYQNIPASGTLPLLEFDLHMIYDRNRLNYRRGAIDTLATQSTVHFNPSLNLDLYLKKDRMRPLTFQISHSSSTASLLNLIDMRDDATPLIVRLGNPGLKGNAFTTFSASLYDMHANFHQWTINANFRYTHRDVAQSVMYNPQTGVYTYRPENISGAYTAKIDGYYYYTFGKNRNRTVHTTADANLHHSIDHSMLAGEKESHENAVNTLTLHDYSYIQYERGMLNVKATGDIRWRHSEGKMRDFSTLNALDYQYGITARYTLPVLKTTISADTNMYSRRGYGSSNLNTDDFVLNASFSQPLMKGKLIARLEAFDLLHNLSSTQYEVNAQGRIETFYRSLPHYAMLHLVYHWNKNPKKTQQ